MTTALRRPHPLAPPVPSGDDPSGDDRSRDDRDDVVLGVARTLHENGEETHDTLIAAEQLGERLHLTASLIPTWGEVRLLVDEDRVRSAAATPSNVNMNRVIATRRAVDALCAGGLDLAGARSALAAASRAPESPLWRFVLACALGAAALSVINGASHANVVGLVVLSAVAGAFVRRGLAKYGANSLVQMFAATLLAGAVGAVGVHLQWNSEMRLVALGPLLVLVPGPTILNGVFDLAALRMPLGGARVGFGLLTVLTLSAGVLIGLALGGATVPPSPPSHPIPFWLDVVAAGITAAAYGVFFAMPPRLLLYPALMSMAAHGTRWWALTVLGVGNAAAAGLACLLAGAVMVPIARWKRLPFAAVGFASVAAMVPGIFLFRMAGGLVQIQSAAGASSIALVGGVLSDGTTALMTVCAMAVGLLLPKRLYDRFFHKEHRT